jgi:hypothetical protein
MQDDSVWANETVLYTCLSEHMFGIIVCMHNSALRDAPRLRDELCEFAAHVHAAQSQLAFLAAEVDATEAWAGEGYRSCAHWLTVNVGFDEHFGSELIRVGMALCELPLHREAAAMGRLSLDKLRMVTKVATPADEDIWLNIALSASGSQLQRICRAYMRTAHADSAEDAAERRARRGVWRHWHDDGMVELRALLPADDASVVLRALEAVAERDAKERSGAVAADERQPDHDPRAASRADALVSICEQVLAHGVGADASVGASPHRLVVHVDAATLVSGDAGGRCHVEDGPGLPPSVARRLGCDTEVVAVVERDGVPVDVGRSRRIVSGRLRRALQVRDRHCRFPGCGVPASRTHGHHVRHWADGGRTDLDNLLSLCGFHHRRLHDGDYTVVRVPESRGAIRFVSARGRPIGDFGETIVTTPGATDLRTLLQTTEPINADSAIACDGGQRLDLRYIISGLARSCELRRESSPHAPPGGTHAPT